MKKTAFTLAELIIVMGVIGFIAIIVLSQTNNIIPNENMAMFKKTYSVTTQIVNSMVNDDDLYPEMNEAGSTDLLGFDNVDAALYKTVERKGKSKFCWLFSEMLNTTSDVTCDDNTAKTFTAGASPNADFTTADGVAWALPITNFDGTDAKSITINGTTYEAYPIYIDINGENEPNCFADDTKCDCKSSTTNTDGSKKCNLPEPDRMLIYITADGETLLPDGSIEEFYIKSEKTSAKYHNKKGN